MIIWEQLFCPLTLKLIWWLFIKSDCYFVPCSIEPPDHHHHSLHMMFLNHIEICLLSTISSTAVWVYFDPGHLWSDSWRLKSLVSFSVGHLYYARTHAMYSRHSRSWINCIASQDFIVQAHWNSTSGWRVGGGLNLEHGTEKKRELIQKDKYTTKHGSAGNSNTQCVEAEPKEALWLCHLPCGSENESRKVRAVKKLKESMAGDRRPSTAGHQKLEPLVHIA